MGIFFHPLNSACLKKVKIVGDDKGKNRKEILSQPQE